MKRIFASLLLVMVLLGSTAASAAVDLTAMTDDELRTLAVDVFTELDRRSESAVNRIGAYNVEIKDAELMKDEDGGDCLVVTFEWSHEKEEAQTFFWSFYYYAFQDGIEIGVPDAYVDMPQNTQDTRIKAGAVLQTQIAFALRNTTSPVEVEVTEYLGETDDKAEKTFDLLASGDIEIAPPEKTEGGTDKGITVIGKPRH